MTDPAHSTTEELPVIKQVIVIRRDLRMRRGKEIAQGAHASMAFLARRVARALDGSPANLDLWPEARAWLSGHFTKVVLQAPDLDTLRRVEAEALARGLEVHVITDRGLTEFGGTPTVTALALGPNRADQIDAVTGSTGVVPLGLY